MKSGREAGYLPEAIVSKVGETPSTTAPFELVEVLFEEAVAEDADGVLVGAELLHDQVVVLAGFDVGAVFADAVAGALEARLVLRRAASLSQAKVRQPASMYSSANESRVPEVGGGPSTSIFTAGSDLLTSFQVVYGFGDQRRRVGRIRHLSSRARGRRPCA